MTQCEVGHGVNLLDNTVRMTFHKVIEKTMVHFSMSPEEARDMAQKLLENVYRVEHKQEVKQDGKEVGATDNNNTLTFED